MSDGIGPANKDFYKCYLTNVVRLDSGSYMIQLSYIGIQGSAPVLRASFKTIAKKQGDKYCFCSPLKVNTLSWKVELKITIPFIMMPFQFS